MKARFQIALLAALLALAFAGQGSRSSRRRHPSSRRRGLAAPAEAAPGAPAADPSRPPLDVELETEGYAYNSGGRRDPFVSLQRPVAADRGPKTRKPGGGAS